MDKKKLLYASPFPPQKSGISDYSEILVHALNKYYDITILIDEYELASEVLKRSFKVAVYGKTQIDFDSYEFKIYNIGNNPQYHSYIYELCLQHPGLIIMHDFVLYYLVVGYYEQLGKVYSKIYEIGGSDAITIIKLAMQREKKELLEYKDIAVQLPLNGELLRSGNKIMVHSNYTKNRVKEIVQDSVKIKKINHIALKNSDLKIIEKRILFSKYGIPIDAIIISSFGYIAETKLNHIVCEAVLKLSKKIRKKICYIMVGEGSYADNYVDNEIVFKTGFITLDEFDSFLEYTDIVMNLRYPSMGETSGGMIRIMEHGKPSIIVNDGWFAEIPKNCAVLLEINELGDLEKHLEHLLMNEQYSKDIGERAKEYVHTYYSAEKVGKEIKDFLECN